MRKQIRVLLVHRDPVLVTLLEWCLVEERRLAVVGRANTTRAAIDLTRSSSPDVVLTDLDFKRIRSLARLQVPARILILAAASHLKERIQAVEMGAHGVVHMRGDHGNISRHTLMKAIEQLVAGDLWVSRLDAMHLIRHLSVLSRSAEPMEPLTNPHEQTTPS